MAKTVKNKTYILDQVPSLINDVEILYFLQKKNINDYYVNTIKELTNINDDVLASWLNLSVKTFREYRKPNTVLKDNLKEHVLLLISLFKHGIQVFGNVAAFTSWLYMENFYFDSNKPETFLNTITGIRFIDDRLTAMEFGDNV